jgi:hypothetical protein
MSDERHGAMWSRNGNAGIIKVNCHQMVRLNAPIESRISSQMIPSFLNYSDTQKFTLPYFAVGFVVFQVIWISFIILVNVAAVGYYESVSISLLSSNSSSTN